VIGSVTNAIYFKPAYHYRFLNKGKHRMDVGAWVLIATAFNNQGTPGNGWYLGTEPGIGLDYKFGGHVQASLMGSILIPGAALDEKGGDANIASGLRFRVTASF
jgi:hypothetical protein